MLKYITKWYYKEKGDVAAMKPLNNKQLRAIEIMVYEPYKQKQEIAEELKVRRETISAWIKREDFQQAIKDETHRKFARLAPRALKEMEKLLDSENERIVFDVSKEILNKAGYQETQKIEQTTHTIEIEIED